MNKPLVTIITPVYNCAEFVGETIKSVCSQNYSNIKHIIIDDASTDTLVKIVKFLIDDVPVNSEKQKFINHKTNQGEQHTVNEGLKLVKGKYFMVVNADDPLLPGAVSKLVAFMEANPDVLCGYPDWRVIDENGATKWNVTTREYDFTWMVRHHNWLPSVGSIFRADLIKTIGLRVTKYKYLGDAEYWLRVGLAGPMARVPMTLACWRNHGAQLSGQKNSKRALDHIEIMREFFNKPNLPQHLLEAKAEAICWSYLVAAVVTGSNLEVLQYAVKAIMVYPRLLVDIKFWDLFLKRAYFILRR